MTTVRKSVFVQRIASVVHQPPAQVSAIVDALLEEVLAALARGDRIGLHQFGTFEARGRSARTGRNPRTGERLRIAASRTVRFQPAKRLRDRVHAPDDVRRILQREQRSPRTVRLIDHPPIPEVFVEPLASCPPPLMSEPSDVPRCRVLCVGGGKGGTGKSVLASNLAFLFARRNRRVTVFDADLGLGNLHLLMNVTPRFNLLHVVREEKRFGDVVEEVRPGLRLVCGGSGIASLATLRNDEIYRIIRGLQDLEASSDVLLVDTAAGLSPRTLLFLRAASEIIVVTTPDITAMTDAYATVKTVLKGNPDARVGIIVNQVASRAQADDVFRKIDSVASKFLRCSLRFLGAVEEDSAVLDSIRRRTPVIVSYPQSAAARSIEAIGERLLTEEKEPRARAPGRFAERLRGVLVGPL
ncbi:MAG: HU family DNA-binding protein [Planctomycetes bacterium]|nr:HU family DNA-binding protein [Planctomycetota bacterium]